jgi:hypothetical protein
MDFKDLMDGSSVSRDFPLLPQYLISIPSRKDENQQEKDAEMKRFSEENNIISTS